MNYSQQHSDRLPGVTVGIASQRLRLDGTRARSLYSWLVERMEQIGVTPDIVTLDAPGFWGAKYKTFQRVKARIEKYDFGGRFRSVHLTRRGPGWSDRHQDDWITTAAITRNPELPANEWCNDTHWIIAPEDAGLNKAEAIDHIAAYAKVAVDHYGYLFSLPKHYAPQYHPTALSGREPFATEEERENTGWWFGYQSEIPGQAMLRDVYQGNFLTKPLLDLQVHGTTLRRWINADSCHGALAPLTDAIWQWTPPPKEIPNIREQLFRAGVLFYYRFFQHWVPDNPWKRDFSKPFVCPCEIPEIFRSTYRRIIDPAN